MQRIYYHKKEILGYIFEIFTANNHLPVSYSCIGRQLNNIYSLFVLIHGNNSLGIGEGVFQTIEELDKATFFIKNIVDEMTPEFVNGRDLIDCERIHYSTALNTCLESFRDNLILGNKLPKVLFDFPYYINSDHCILKLYQYQPPMIKLNIGGDYKKDIELAKRVQQVIEAFNLQTKIRIYANGRYTEFEAYQFISKLDKKQCEYLMQFLSDLNIEGYKNLKNTFNQFEFGLEFNAITNGLCLDDWVLKVNLQDCGSFAEVIKVIKNSKKIILFGSEISGYVNNFYELYLYETLKERINPYIETTGFLFLDEEISGITYISRLRCMVDLRKSMNSLLEILGNFRKK